MLASVIGYAARGGIPVSRTSLLRTNPILAAPAWGLVLLADRRISAGFIVEAAAGAAGLHHSLILFRINANALLTTRA
jgi:hypothetical protein